MEWIESNSCTRRIMQKLTLKTNDDFQVFYLNGKPFHERKSDDEIDSFLRKLGLEFGFTFSYDGELTQEEMEKFS